MGLDTIEMGNVLSVFMEATDKGLTNGDSLAWGDADGQIAVIEHVAYRADRMADILAEGAAAAENIGRPRHGDVRQGAGHPGL